MTNKTTDVQRIEVNDCRSIELLSEPADRVLAPEWEDRSSETTRPIAGRQPVAARGGTAKTRINPGIAQVLEVMKAFRRVMHWADRSLSTMLRELFAILAVAYPEGKRPPVKIHRRARVIMFTLKFTHPIEADLIDEWLILITGLAQQHNAPETSSAVRKMLAQIAREYPRNSGWACTFQGSDTLPLRRRKIPSVR
jgi:hypothetical protein